MESRIVKLNPRSLPEMIEYYDKLAEAVSRSEFGPGMLASPGREPPRPGGLQAII
jgi:hypothetical protein